MERLPENATLAQQQPTPLPSANKLAPAFDSPLRTATGNNGDRSPGTAPLLVHSRGRYRRKVNFWEVVEVEMSEMRLTAAATSLTTVSVWSGEHRGVSAGGGAGTCPPRLRRDWSAPQNENKYSDGSAVRMRRQQYTIIK